MNPIQPEKPATASSQFFTGSKGLIIAIIAVLVAAIIGISALIGFKSPNTYQGMIQKIQQQTEDLRDQNSSS